jgi:hypothetical protein
MAFVFAFTSVSSAALITDFESTGLFEGDTITNQIPGLLISGGKLCIEGGDRCSFSNRGGTPTRDYDLDDTATSGDPLTTPSLRERQRVMTTASTFISIPSSSNRHSRSRILIQVQSLVQKLRN